MSGALRFHSGGQRRGLTDDDAFACQFFGEVDLVAGRSLNKVDVGELVADLDEGRGRGMEETVAGLGARQRQAAGGGREHDVMGGRAEQEQLRGARGQSTCVEWCRWKRRWWWRWWRW